MSKPTKLDLEHAENRLARQMTRAAKSKRDAIALKILGMMVLRKAAK